MHNLERNKHNLLRNYSSPWQPAAIYEIEKIPIAWMLNDDVMKNCVR
jgi:hypothetical protein